jgi:hypothetical protein
VKEDLFMHSSCIEHFVIRAKLMDLNELELIGVTQQKASSQLPINMLALATETIETHPDLERYAHWKLAKR